MEKTLILLMGVLLCTACQKEETPSKITKTLMGSVWKIAGASIEPPIYSPILGGLTNDYFTYFVSDCVYDNLLSFLPDQKMQIDEGSLKCNSNDPQVVNGFWQLNLDETKIETALADSTLFISYEIKTLTNYTLEVRYYQNFNGNDYLLEERYHAYP